MLDDDFSGEESGELVVAQTLWAIGWLVVGESKVQGVEAKLAAAVV